MAKKVKTTEEKKDFDYRELITFEDFCRIQNIDPTALPILDKIPEEFRAPLLAVYQLMVAYKGIKNGKKLDWNSTDYKYFAWLGIDADEARPSGFRFYDSGCRFTSAYSVVGSRLSADDSDKVMHIIKHFNKQYEDFFLEK